MQKKGWFEKWRESVTPDEIKVFAAVVGIGCLLAVGGLVVWVVRAI